MQTVIKSLVGFGEYPVKYEIDLTWFAVENPVLAYVTDVGNVVGELSGLSDCGEIIVQGQPKFMWLDGPRVCRKLKVFRDNGKPIASFMGASTGEFCVEIFRLFEDGDVMLLHQDDFVWK